MRPPVIGITTRANPEMVEHGHVYLAYADAVKTAGGEPVFLDPRPVTAPDAARIVEGLDGLLLSGGRDIHPRYYEPDADYQSLEDLASLYNMTCEAERDEFEIPLATVAYQSRLPILGICRGFQLLNVILGGGMIKDICTDLPHKACLEGDVHGRPAGESERHGIALDAGSRIAGIVGSSLSVVNSRHHQGITAQEKSAKLIATAVAPDGIIEAVESEDHPWAIAVQWHPERSEDGYIFEPCKKLFTAFVQAAGAY